MSNHLLRARGALLASVATSLVIILALTPMASAISQAQIKTMQQGVLFFNVEDDCVQGQTEQLTLEGNSHAEQAYNFFTGPVDSDGMGLTPFQAAVIIGTMQAESGTGLDPTALNSIGAFGIAQWLSGRKENLKSFAGSNINDFATQLQFVQKELSGAYKGSLSKLQAVDTASLSIQDQLPLINQAVYDFEATYEVSGHVAIPKRQANAKNILLTYGAGVASGTTVEVSSSSSSSSGCSGGGGLFRIATFNVRGAHHTAGYIARSDKSIGVITSNQIDIIGLQEFESEQRSYYLSKLADYDIFPEANASNKNSRAANSIIWNKAKFELVSSGYQPDLVYFCDTGSRTPNKMDAPYVKLRYTQTGQELYVLNTHDPANSDNNACANKAPHYRYLNAQAHLKLIEKLAAEGLPVFYTGDFNSRYSLIKNTSINGSPYQGEAKNLTYCILTGSDLINDAYDVYEKRDAKCPNSTPPGAGSGIDHVYITKDVSVNGYKTVAAGTNGSDHPTIMFDISMASQSNNTSSGTCNVSAPITGAGGNLHQLTKAELSKIYGDVGTADDHPEIKLVTVDFLGKKVQVHQRAAGCLQAVANEIKSKNSSYKITTMGCYRYNEDASGILGTASYHNYGIACDINPDTNPHTKGTSKHDMPDEYVQAFYHHGWSWGGDWRTSKDYMHFEFNGIAP